MSPWAATRRAASAGGDAATGQPGRLGRRVAGHQPDLVADRGQAALHELDGLDHDGRRTVGLGGGHGGLDRPAHVRVGQGFQPARAPGSPNTVAASAPRSSPPSGPATAGPNAATIAARTAGSSVTCRAIASASTTTAPRAANHVATVDLPQPMGPVSPIRTVRRGAPARSSRRPFLEGQPGVLRLGQGRVHVGQLAGHPPQLDEVGLGVGPAQGQLEL